MSLTALPNVGSQLDRAIIAYLISLEVGTSENIYPAHTSIEKVLPSITVKSYSSSHEQQSGVENYQVSIQCMAEAVIDSSTPTVIDNLVGLVMAAMLQSEDGETLDYTAAQITETGRALAVSDPDSNADMADFTLNHLYYKGAQRGKPDDDNSIWAEVRNFEAHVSPSNLG